MLTPEEEKFLAYWAAERNAKRGVSKKLVVGLPLFALLAVAFFVNFLSGWYGKADKEIRRHSSLIIVVLVAVIAVAVFFSIFSARYRWEQNESDYQSLLKKKAAEEKTS